jgi:acetylornithine deacetylase/succinyl-diaminopimelate desuccinylase-like protein
MRSSRLVAVLVGFLVAGCVFPGGSRAQDDGPDGEVVGLLQDLIRIDTSNPPGNEAQVAELLRRRLEPLGFAVEIVPTPTAGKAHMIARLRAQNPTAKPLLLAGHEDVVGVERDLWTVDPFAGLLRGGDIFGRGSMDFKGGLAAFTVAASRLARAKVALKRDIILLAEADEEGGDYGTGWLAKTAYPKIDAGVSLNEGGWIFEDGRGTPRLMGITTIDKNSLSVTLETRGTSTHSSRPLPNSALARLTRALNRIERYEPATPRPGATARRYLRAWAKGFGGRTARNVRTFLAARTARARRVAARRLAHGNYGELFNGLLRTIYVPTIVSGGFRSNVLPGSAEATVNIRLLPGARPRPAIRELERVIADRRVRVTPIAQTGETVTEVLDRFDQRARQRPSSVDTDLYRALAREGRREWPTAKVTPALFEAGTDAVPWRQRGVPVYGVYPYPISRAELADMHGNDEHISIRRLEEGTDMLTRVVRAVAAR